MAWFASVLSFVRVLACASSVVLSYMWVRELAGAVHGAEQFDTLGAHFAKLWV